MFFPQIVISLVVFGMTMSVALAASEFIEPLDEIMNRGADGLVPSAAGQASEQSPVLTLEACLALAQRDNLSLKSQEQEVKGAAANASASFRDMLPDLSLSSSRSDIIGAPKGSSTAESYSTTLTVTQPVFHGGALWNQWKKSTIAHEQSVLDTQRQVQTLTKDVKSSWFDLLKAMHQAKEATAALERLHEHALHAQAFFNEGSYWANDVLQAQVKIAQGEQSLIEAENDVAVAKATLNQLMHRPITAPFEISGTLTFTPLQRNLDDLFSFALKNRDDLEKSKLSLLSSRLTQQIKEGSMLPTLDVTGSRRWNGEDIGYDNAQPTTTILMNMNWSAWEWGKTMKERQAAQANTEKSNLDSMALEESVLLEVRKAFLDAQEFGKKVHVLTQSMDQAKENYRVNQIRYQEKLGTATDVLDAMDLLTTTRNNHTSALSSYLKALAALDLAVGHETEGSQP